jgi:beta-glucanase (GH16 family)
MKFHFLKFAALVALKWLLIPLAALAQPPAGAWVQTLNDNFDALDKTRWSTGWGYWKGGKVGGEIGTDGRTRSLAYYPDKNVEIVFDPQAGSNVARLRAAKEDTLVPWEGNKTYHYTSGVLASYAKFAQQYGYFEIRAKTFDSKARGYINDFWLRSTDPIKWPPEIDIFETAGSEAGNKAHLFLHYNDGEGKKQSDSRERVLDAGSNYHTYAIHWEPGKITWYVDGVSTGKTITAGVPAEPMVLLISAEIWNDHYPGNPELGTWPQFMWIDFVRVWTPNLLQNPRFENAGGWRHVQFDAAWNATRVTGFRRSRNSVASHVSDGPLRIETSQTFSHLENGLYTLRAKARSNRENSSFLKAKALGEKPLLQPIPLSSTQQNVELKNIRVRNGRCTVGVWTDAKSGVSCEFDDVEFFRQPEYVN